MEQYKREFIDFMVEAGALQFGSFTLKSGRVSPFYVNTGAYVTGEHLKRLASFYAQAIHDHYGTDFDVLFGPAYKGIPLAVATATELYERYGAKVRYASNRKEIKDHGDAGIMLGATLSDGDRIVIIEDVTTSGASMAETVPILRTQAKVDILGLIVSLNREEKGRESEKSALDEIKSLYGFDAHAIVTMREVIEALPLEQEMLDAIDAYYRQYGAVS